MSKMFLIVGILFSVGMLEVGVYVFQYSDLKNINKQISNYILLWRGKYSFQTQKMEIVIGNGIDYNESKMKKKHNEKIQQIYLYAKNEFRDEEYVPTYFTL